MSSSGSGGGFSRRPCSRWRSPAAQQRQTTTARGIDPNQGRSLVEVTLPNKAAAIRLQLEPTTYGIDFNDHYLRNNANGTVTVTVFGTDDELAALDAAGYELGTTIEGPATWRDRLAERQADVKAETAGRRGRARRGRRRRSRREDEIVVLRVDYFENYAGRFLSVEAKDGSAARRRRADVHRPVALALLEHRRGHADQLGAADDERQHRPGHDAGHLHRAPRARAASATPAARRRRRRR